MLKKEYLYAPGCALMVYKPYLADKLKDIIEQTYSPVNTLLSCCLHKPTVNPGTNIITACATCAEQYTKKYPDCTSIFFLSELAESNNFPFPDYKGAKMSIQDTCSARSKPEYLNAIRKLLKRMNITLVEPQRSGARSKCCGQVFYGKVNTLKVESLMKVRADEMPSHDVIVYCASCIMSMSVGGKCPRYIIDLLFNEPTEFKGLRVESWNNRLFNFKEDHKPQL